MSRMSIGSDKPMDSIDNESLPLDRLARAIASSLDRLGHLSFI